MLKGIGVAAAICRSFVVHARVAVVGVGALLVGQQALAAYEVVTVTNGGTHRGRRHPVWHGTRRGPDQSHQESGLLRANDP